MTPADARGAAGRPGSPAQPASASLPAELAEVLAAVTPPGGRFGHREHIHLAFAAVQRYGPAAAPAAVAGWLRQLTAHHGAPQKFHATMTEAWARLVAHHAAGCPPGSSFEDFAASAPALLDKHLLSRHYSAGLLASPAARASWADPDLAPLPAAAPPGRGGSAPSGPP